MLNTRSTPLVFAVGDCYEVRMNAFLARFREPRRLDAGDAFPRMAWQLVDGGTLTIPNDFEGRWAVVLFYRGHW